MVAYLLRKTEFFVKSGHGESLPVAEEERAKAGRR